MVAEELPPPAIGRGCRQSGVADIVRLVLELVPIEADSLLTRPFARRLSLDE